jgi:hypothetical protein
MGLLTDRTLATGVTLTDYIHVVIPTDISQNPAGSSYKATVGQVGDIFSSLFVNQSGGTMTGPLVVPSVSATTYYNLPSTSGLYLPLSGGTVTGGTIFTSGLTANTISATTYYNLPIDPNTYVTGFTYGNNVFTLKQNNGQPDLNATINVVTGMTVNGNLTVTGNTLMGSITANTLSATTYYNLPSTSGLYLPLSGGTVTGGTIFTSGLTASTLNLSSTPAADTGLTTNYLTRDGATGEVKIKQTPGPTVYGLFAQTGDSLTVSATTVETTIIGPGVGGLSVPANTFKIGDSFQLSMDGLITCINTATIHIHARTTGGVLLCDTGVLDLDTSTLRPWTLTLYFTIREIGGTTVASISSGGLFSYIKDSGLTYEGYTLSFINDIDFDTTIVNTLSVNVLWNTTNSGNRIFSRNLTLTKIF